MRSKVVVLFLLVGLSLSFGYAQQDTQKVTEEESHRMGQDLIDLLQAGRYFEAKSLYDTIRIKVDSIHPFLENLYRMYISSFENKPDSAAFYIEEIIKHHFVTNINPYLSLWEVYAEVLQDYEKAYQTLERIRSYLKQNPDSLSIEELKRIRDYLIDLEGWTRRRAAEPTIRIVRDDTENSTPILADTVLQQGYLFFHASYNGHQPISTLFDTGASEYVFMDKTIAEQVGVRKYPVYENDTTFTINGINVFGYLGILDSLQMANITLYHIPVGVFDMKSTIYIPDTFEVDSLKREEVISRFYQASSVVLGLKAMKWIEKIIIDQENNRLCFPSVVKEPEKVKDRNMFWSYNRLFTSVEVNNCAMMTLIDSGINDYIRIDTCFYEKHKSFIPVDTLKEKKYNNKTMIGRTQPIPFEIIAKEPVIIFNSQVIHPEKGDDVCISSFSQWGEIYSQMVEATVGFPFLKRLGKKILFDFRNMRMEVLE